MMAPNDLGNDSFYPEKFLIIQSFNVPLRLQSVDFLDFHGAAGAFYQFQIAASPSVPT
jgi:hypothetical protein